MFPKKVRRVSMLCITGIHDWYKSTKGLKCRRCGRLKSES